jgi:uncharacterized protein YkwD
MEIENSEWFGEARGTNRRGLIAALLVGACLLLAVNPPVSDRLGYTPPFGFSDVLPGGHTQPWIRQLVAGTSGTTPAAESLYPANDPWRESLASERTCPGGEDKTAPADAQVSVMLCLLNFARIRQGLEPLALSGMLNLSAAAKAIDIIRCEEVEHGACGNEPNQVAVDVGYRGPFGENLYAAEGRFAAPRVALDRWLNSPQQRENLFRPEWRTVGIAVLGGASLADLEDGEVWVNQFGV